MDEWGVAREEETPASHTHPESGNTSTFRDLLNVHLLPTHFYREGNRGSQKEIGLAQSQGQRPKSKENLLWTPARPTLRAPPLPLPPAPKYPCPTNRRRELGIHPVLALSQLNDLEQVVNSLSLIPNTVQILSKYREIDVIIGPISKKQRVRVRVPARGLTAALVQVKWDIL